MPEHFLLSSRFVSGSGMIAKSERQSGCSACLCAGADQSILDSQISAEAIFVEERGRNCRLLKYGTMSTKKVLY